MEISPRQCRVPTENNIVGTRHVAVYNAGQISRIKCYVKNGQRLPATGLYGLLNINSEIIQN